MVARTPVLGLTKIIIEISRLDTSEAYASLRQQVPNSVPFERNSRRKTDKIHQAGHNGNVSEEPHSIVVEN